MIKKFKMSMTVKMTLFKMKALLARDIICTHKRNIIKKSNI